MHSSNLSVLKAPSVSDIQTVQVELRPRSLFACPTLKDNENANTEAFMPTQGGGLFPLPIPIGKLQDHLDTHRGIQTGALMGSLSLQDLSHLIYQGCLDVDSTG